MNKIRDKISITVEDMEDIIGDEHEDFVTIREKYEGEWKHGTEHSLVVQRLSDSKFFRFFFRASVKDEMCFSDMNDSTDMTEVFEVTKTVTDYV